MEEELKLIKKIILDIAKKYGIEIDRIILFGSRARGDYRENSDWDILIVTKEKLDWKIRKKFLSEVRRTLVSKEMLVEIVVVDSRTFDEYKSLTGFVYYWAEREGVPII